MSGCKGLIIAKGCGGGEWCTLFRVEWGGDCPSNKEMITSSYQVIKENNHKKSF